MCPDALMKSRETRDGRYVFMLDQANYLSTVTKQEVLLDKVQTNSPTSASADPIRRRRWRTTTSASMSTSRCCRERSARAIRAQSGARKMSRTIVRERDRKGSPHHAMSCTRIHVSGIVASKGPLRISTSLPFAMSPSFRSDSRHPVMARPQSCCDALAPSG
eukprot:6209754-Pleurochrysis_carterae.AAC.2